MRIPFKLVVGIMLIDAKVNGKAGHLVFDTGAVQTTLNTRYFNGEDGDIKAYTYDATEHENMNTNTVQMINSVIEFSSYKIENNTVAIDMSYVENPLKEIDKDVVFLGSLGFDFIKDHKVTIDYENKVIILDEDFEKKGVQIPLEMGIVPMMDVTINGNDYKFVFDTGASYCVFNTDFNDIFDIQPDEKGLFKAPLIKCGSVGILEATSQVADLSAIKDNFGASGIIGYPLLKDYISNINFENKMLTLVK